MKKLLSLALMIMFVVTLAACDGTVTLPTDIDLTTVPEQTEEPTDAPTTGVPTTGVPTTGVPTTDVPTTGVPTTEAPTTEAPTTDAPTTDAPTTAGDTTPPVISGTQDVEIFINSTFDPMAGVTATDDVDGDITDQITVSSTALLESGMLDTSKTGDFFVRYTVEDSAGNPAEKLIMISIVIDPSQLGDEMIQNGDFSLGAGVWTIGLNEGGAGDFSVIEEIDGETVNEVGVVNITAAGWSNPFPRLDSNVTEFENGKTYQITFEAKADAARPINVQVGQLLPSAPWFVDYKPLQPQIFDLTTEWDTYTFKFTMNQDADLGALLEGQLLFEHGGTIEGEVTVPEENYATKVYYDNVVITEAEPDPDTEAPVLTGVADVTIEKDATFDPLAGVTAIDIVDGAITLDASHYVSDVDTSTAGEYTVVYTVSDSTGNEASVTRNVTVVELVFNPTTDIIDGSFTTTTDIVAETQDTEENGFADITDEDIWYHYIAGWDGAAATFNVTDGAAVIDVTTAGNSDWGVQLKQKGIELVQGQTYKLTFTASSSADRDIIAKVTDAYFETFNLTSTATEFSFVFTYEGADRTNARVMFMLGNTANFAAGAVTIDDVELSVLAQEDLVVNDEFDFNGWTVWSQDWDSGNGIPAVTYEINEGVFEITTDLFGDANWAIQLYQEGLVLESGVTYRVTFDAMADTVRYINVKLIDGDGAEFFETKALTSTMDTYTFEFTYNGTSTVGKLDFELGFIDPDLEDTIVPEVGTVSLDNVKFEEVESSAIVADSNQIVNGTFDQIVGWSSWAGEGGAAEPIEIVDGQLMMEVTNLGTANWNIQLFQDGITLVPGATYTLVFNAKASVARDMNFVLIAGGEYRETFDLTTEMAMYSYTFIYDGTATSGKLDFELGNISDASKLAIVTFENINFFRNYNAFEEPTTPTEPNEPNPDAVIKETDGWRAFVNDWEGGAANFNVIDDVLVFEATAINAYQSWTNQVIQDAFALGTGVDNEGSMQFEAGKTYRITFDAQGSIAGDINVAVGWTSLDGNNTWTEYYMEVVSITTDMATYTVEFTLDDTTADYTTLAQLKFELGNLFNGQTAPQTFMLDNVVIEVMDGTAYVDAGLVVNGDMSEGAEVVETVDALATPVGLVVNNDTLAWAANENADSFEIYIDGVTNSPFTSTTPNFDLTTLSLDAGTYSIQVKAIGDGTNFTDSELSTAISYEVVDGVQQLATPVGLVVNSGTLAWAANSNASSFEIYIDGATDPAYVSTVANFDLAALSLTAGTYDIQVKAIGDGTNFTDSELSASVTYTVE